jgi:hypothetical protein
VAAPQSQDGKGGDAQALVLIDGYRRVGALRRLGRDTVGVEQWEPMRWLAPSFGEMGSEIPAGMRGRIVRPGEDRGDAFLADNIEVVEISLRQARGEFIDDAEVSETYRRHQRASVGRSIGLLTFGDATGAPGPREQYRRFPQARISDRDFGLDVPWRAVIIWGAPGAAQHVRRGVDEPGARGARRGFQAELEDRPGVFQGVCEYAALDARLSRPGASS